MAKHLIVPLEQGIFYPFHDGYLLPTKNLDVTNAVIVDEQLFSNTALTIWAVHCVNVKECVGYFFKSPFSIRCEGGYLIAFIQQNAGNCTKGNRVFKNDYLILFNYPNYGVLAVSPKIAPWLEQVFEEQ